MKTQVRPAGIAEGPHSISEAIEIESGAPAIALYDLLEPRRNPAPVPRPVEQPSGSGRTIECRPAGNGADALTIRDPLGKVELEVLLTRSGPVLRFRSADLQIQSSGKVEIACADFHVSASGSIVQTAGGDLLQEISGDATLKTQGRLATQAHTTEIRSTRGDVRIQANDDVRLNGERVKLNC